MPYQDNVPQGAQTIDGTQSPIQENFQEINTVMGTDHIDMVSVGAGKHALVRFVDVSNQTFPTFDTGELAIFNAVPANISQSSLNVIQQNEIFIRKGNNGIYNLVPMTASVLSTSNPVDNGAGWTYLPSGILMKWLFATVPAAGSQLNLDTTSGGPALRRMFNIQATPGTLSIPNNPRFLTVQNIAPPSVTIRCFDGAGNPVQGNVYLMVIGR